MSDSDGRTLPSFDKANFIAAFGEAMPLLMEEVGDLFERPTIGLRKKDQQEMLRDISWGIEASMPDLIALEALGRNTAQAKKAYSIIDGLLKKFFRRARIRLKPQEDALDYILRKHFDSALKVPASVNRLKQYRIIRQGLEMLVVGVISVHGGESAARQLINEYQQKHIKEDMRFFNSLETRVRYYQNIRPKRVTSNVITKLADEYQHMSSAFEKRLRLLVGLNRIARGNPETWGDLRRLGYNELLQAVGAADNPLLHFLKDVVDRNVRNVLMHGGHSFSPSKGIVRFIDYSAKKKAETEIEWTPSRFYRKTKNLTLTMCTVAQLEALFLNICLDYCLRYMRAVGIK